MNHAELLKSETRNLLSTHCEVFKIYDCLETLSFRGGITYRAVVYKDYFVIVILIGKSHA